MEDLGVGNVQLGQRNNWEDSEFERIPSQVVIALNIGDPVLDLSASYERRSCWIGWIGCNHVSRSIGSRFGEEGKN